MTARSTPRFESLDHWRGIACLMVIVYHSTMVYRSYASRVPATLADAVIDFTHTLNVGVALFFVISGYCIGAAADNNRKHNAAIGQYFLRRFRRIYPPLLDCCLLFRIAVPPVRLRLEFPLLSSPPWAQLRPWWYSPTQWLGNLTLTETWRHHLFGAQRGHFPGQAWTLCYEEQFYFVTGMLLVCARHRFFAGVAAISAFTLAIALGCALRHLPIEGFFFDGSWLLFAAGVAVYYRIHYATSRTAPVVDGLLLAALGVSLFVTAPIYGASVGFGFAALLPWLYRMDRLFASTVFNPLLVCGRMCYSLYLVHQIPVKGVSMALYRAGVTSATATLTLTIPGCIATSVILGWAFYQLVERRFLNSPARASRPSLLSAVPVVEAIG